MEAEPSGNQVVSIGEQPSDYHTPTCSQYCAAGKNRLRQGG